jgi:hypothetical protein
MDRRSQGRHLESAGVGLPRNEPRFAYCANGYMEDSRATLYRKALR